jgi:hypothetical protein
MPKFWKDFRLDKPENWRIARQVWPGGGDAHSDKSLPLIQTVVLHPLVGYRFAQPIPAVLIGLPVHAVNLDLPRRRRFPAAVVPAIQGVLPG